MFLLIKLLFRRLPLSFFFLFFKICTAAFPWFIHIITPQKPKQRAPYLGCSPIRIDNVRKGGTQSWMSWCRAASSTGPKSSTATSTNANHRLLHKPEDEDSQTENPANGKQTRQLQLCKQLVEQVERCISPSSSPSSSPCPRPPPLPSLPSLYVLPSPSVSPLTSSVHPTD